MTPWESRPRMPPWKMQDKHVTAIIKKTSNKEPEQVYQKDFFAEPPITWC